MRPRFSLGSDQTVLDVSDSRVRFHLTRFSIGSFLAPVTEVTLLPLDSPRAMA